MRSRNAGSRIVLTGDSRITIVGSSPNYYEMTSADFIGDLSTGFTVIASTPPFGLEAELGGQIDATGATINVSSQSGAGVYGASQGTVNLNNVTVETTGEFSNGAFVNNATINGVDFAHHGQRRQHLHGPRCGRRPGTRPAAPRGPA